MSAKLMDLEETATILATILLTFSFNQTNPIFILGREIDKLK